MAVPARRVISVTSSGERADPAPVAQENWDEAVKLQAVPQLGQLAGAGEQWQGHEHVAGFQTCARALHASPAVSLAAELGSNLPACCKVWGQHSLAALHLHNLCCCSPTERWERASAWLPSIALLPWLQQHKGLQIPSKRALGVAL